LKGLRPTELPIEEPTRFEFTINMKTAEALGISLPPMVLARADRIAE
jgi:putative ABC transport system substrate-binding protein